MKRLLLLLAPVLSIIHSRQSCPKYYCMENPDPNNKCISQARRGNFYIHPPPSGYECHVPSKFQKREYPAIKRTVAQEILEGSLYPGQVATSPEQCISGKIQYINSKGVCRSQRKLGCDQPYCFNFDCRHSYECDVGYHCLISPNQSIGKCSKNKEIGQSCSSTSKCQPWANCDFGICVEVFSKDPGQLVSSPQNKMLCKSMYIIVRSNGSLECAKRGPKLKYTADNCQQHLTIIEQLEMDKQRMRSYPGDQCVYQILDKDDQRIEITKEAECTWSQSGKAFCPILEGDPELACRLEYAKKYFEQRPNYHIESFTKCDVNAPLEGCLETVKLGFLLNHPAASIHNGDCIRCSLTSQYWYLNREELKQQECQDFSSLRTQDF